MVSQRTLLIAGAAIAAFGLAIWGGSAWSEDRHSKKAEAAQLLVEQAKGEAKITKDQAIKADEKAAVAETAKQSADAQAATAKRELARLRAGLANKPPFSSNAAGSTPAASGAEGGAIPADSVEGVPQLLAIIHEQNKDLSQLKALVASEDSLVEAQDAQIKARDTQIQLLTVSRDQWKATAGHLQDQADAQALAAAEWRKAVGAGERRAGIKWGVIGMGVGFLVGRR